MILLLVLVLSASQPASAAVRPQAEKIALGIAEVLKILTPENAPLSADRAQGYNFVVSSPCNGAAFHLEVAFSINTTCPETSQNVLDVGSYYSRSSCPTPSGKATKRSLSFLGESVAAKGAFEIAKAGGKHAGFLKNYAGRTPAEIQKGIASIEKEIEKHRSWIANPQSKIPNFRSLDPRQQAALINSKWPGDIARQQEQLDILRGLLGGN